ncbi:nickel ABC transporter substrate-binding protein [Clostridium sp. Marseille-P2415]|uniref:nickel ABC transporter substrate-binding protein n=1 Tax=Clostridium sp. Marseille-P2415 TaxID=1805471 RepID=UPI0009888B14|nr:nickel ABC transporter substrate-binding protein [Clostridium sp. Marseille-P2415]
MRNRYKKLLSAVLGCALMALYLVGCGNQSAATSTESQTPLSEEKESKTRVLTVVTAKELDSLTTLTMNKENNIACGLVYETLVSYKNGEIVPMLAKSWSWDDTNTILTFKLHEGITFTDGALFNAESVKAILEFDKSNPNFSGIKGIYNIQSVEVVDEYTVAVHYEAPCYSYLNDFCFQNVAGMMSPNVFEAENFQTFTDIVGTGPYVRAEFISGDCTRFVRNEKYWGEAPYYDEVVVKYIPEASSRLQALQTGEVDLIYGADLITYDDYNQALSLDDIEGAINDGSTLTRNLVLNASSSKLGNVKVRQAVACAVNKKEITEGLTYGYETPATALFGENAPYTDITYNTTWNFDLDKANALLDEAGWMLNKSTGFREKDGETLTLNYTYWTDLSLAQDMALAIKTQLAKAGIDVVTTGQDQMTWWTEGVAGNYDITTWNTEGSYTEAHKYLQESLGADPHAISLQALEDFQTYSDAVNQFSTSADSTVVQSAVAAALNISNDNVIDLPVSYAKDLVVYNSAKVAGYTFSSVPQFFDINNVKPVE